MKLTLIPNSSMSLKCLTENPSQNSWNSLQKVTMVVNWTSCMWCSIQNHQITWSPHTYNNQPKVIQKFQLVKPKIKYIYPIYKLDDVVTPLLPPHKIKKSFCLLVSLHKKCLWYIKLMSLDKGISREARVEFCSLF